MILNVDAGELATEPSELYAVAHLVHVACGGHAGDAASMERVLRLAAAAGTRVGAHPAYPDRENFGRKTMAIDLGALTTALDVQCSELADVARRIGMSVTSLKPHGALYHDANRDRRLADAVVAVAARIFGTDATVVGPPSGELEAATLARGLPFLREGFADRGTRSDGSLVPRGEPGALIEDPAAAAKRAVDLAKAKRFDTVCVHGDTPQSLTIARAVRAALDAMPPAEPA